MVEGSTDSVEIVYDGSLKEQVTALMETGMSSKEAIKEVAKRNQVKTNGLSCLSLRRLTDACASVLNNEFHFSGMDDWVKPSQKDMIY